MLVYSSNAATRAQVMSAVGTRPDPALGVVDFVEQVKTVDEHVQRHLAVDGVPRAGPTSLIARQIAVRDERRR